jgi:uncharacterized protein YciI
MPHVIVALDKPGSAGLRAELRPAHIEHLTRHAAKLLAAGPMLAEDGTTPMGSMIVFDSDDRAEVEAFIQSDPYTKGALFEAVTVRPWRKVFLGGQKAG